MERENKVRISCSNCLYSKILLLHESDPFKTRFIISDSCEKCNTDNGEGNGLRYFDSNMRELSINKRNNSLSDNKSKFKPFKWLTP